MAIESRAGIDNSQPIIPEIDIFADGVIEDLVREGRTPQSMGILTQDYQDAFLLYIPPVGFDNSLHSAINTPDAQRYYVDKQGEILGFATTRLVSEIEYLGISKRIHTTIIDAETNPPILH